MDGPAGLRPRQQAKLARGAKAKEHAMSHKLNSGIAVIGIDIGKNSFHIVVPARCCKTVELLCRPSAVSTHETDWVG
jgi:hypothetical protein